MHSRLMLQLPLRPIARQLNLLSRLPVRNFATNAGHPSVRQRSPWRRRLLYFAIFSTTGYMAAENYVYEVFYPLTPGSEMDEMALQRIRRLSDALPMVQQLSKDPNYLESGVYENFSEEKKPHRLTSGPMAGSRGLALQRVFWNDKAKEVISIIHLGTALDGWPTMVHGGAIGTVIDENMGRAAIRHFPARTGVTANLDIDYRAPVWASQFYVFHTKLDQERSTDRKAYAKCQVRNIYGKVCVEATGLFVVPKTLQLAEVGERF